MCIFVLISSIELKQGFHNRIFFESIEFVRNDEYTYFNFPTEYAVYSYESVWFCNMELLRKRLSRQTHTHTHPHPHRKHIFHTAECIAGTMQMFINGSTHAIMRSLQNGDESWHFREF